MTERWSSSHTATKCGPGPGQQAVLSCLQMQLPGRHRRLSIYRWEQGSGCQAILQVLPSAMRVASLSPVHLPACGSHLLLQTPCAHPQLAGTHVTAAGVAQLEQLPRLQFLDMRGTGIARAALAPVQRRFALQFVQAAVSHLGAGCSLAACLSIGQQPSSQLARAL